MKRDREPVLIRSKWGTNRWVYNHRNPVGRTLIVVSVLLCLGLLLYVVATTHDPGPGKGAPSDTVR